MSTPNHLTTTNQTVIQINIMLPPQQTTVVRGIPTEPNNRPDTIQNAVTNIAWGIPTHPQLNLSSTQIAAQVPTNPLNLSNQQPPCGLVNLQDLSPFSVNPLYRVDPAHHLPSTTPMEAQPHEPQRKKRKPNKAKDDSPTTKEPTHQQAPTSTLTNATKNPPLLENLETADYLKLLHEFNNACKTQNKDAIEDIEQKFHLFNNWRFDNINFDLKCPQSNSNILHAALMLATHKTIPKNLRAIKEQIQCNVDDLLQHCIEQNNASALLDFCNQENSAIMLFAKEIWPVQMLNKCLLMNSIIPIKYILLSKAVAQMCHQAQKIDILNDYLTDKYSKTYPYKDIRKNQDKQLAYLALAIHDALENNEKNTARALIHLIPRKEAFNLPTNKQGTTYDNKYSTIRHYISTHTQNPELLERFDLWKAETKNLTHP